MADRRGRNRISGPRSALTDFLASHNISAAEITRSYEQRRQAAQQQNAAETQRLTAEGASNTRGQSDEGEDEDDDDDVIALQEPSPESEESPASATRKRKRGTQREKESASKEKEKEKAKAKEKAALKKKKARRGRAGSITDSDDEYLDAIGSSMYRKAQPTPGQLENCEICEKRFTVTAYSKTGPEGGLVCAPCGKELAKDEQKISKPAKKPGSGKARRKVESNRLDGDVKLGPRSLQDLCIAKVADYNQDIDEFGDLPEDVLLKLSEIFTKRRIMDSRTLQLFLRADRDTIAIHDCANLEVEDFTQIFSVAPSIKKLVLRNACQFKDSVLNYMVERVTKLTHFHVYAANLISNDAWVNFFKQRGHQLESLKLQWLDATFDDSVVACMAEYCPNLERLKLKHCRQIGPDSLQTLTRLEKLKHLSLDLEQIGDESSEPHAQNLVDKIGPQLHTLSIENTTWAFSSGDCRLQSIKNCTNLDKLRLAPLRVLDDTEIAALFTIEPMRLIPQLRFLDLSGGRDMIDEPERGEGDHPSTLGVASVALPQIMKHSGATLEHLNVSSCRHISHAAFIDAFGDSSTQFPQLKQLDISFCNDVDTSIIRAIFRSCPKLEKLTAFGCFKIDNLPVPSGVALIGVPRAQDEIVKIGDASASNTFGLDNIAGGGGGVVGVTA